MKPRIMLLALGCLLAAAADPVTAQEPLVQKVKAAIKKGVGHLRTQQRPDGSWLAAPNNFLGNTTPGTTCLVMLALLEAGEPLNDPMMVKGLGYVRQMEEYMTYGLSLQTQVLAKAGQDVDKNKIKKNVETLIGGRVFVDGKMKGWGYSFDPNKQKSPGTASDNSNSQFALLGLWAARDARIPGINIDKDVWSTISKYYCDSQNKDGSWDYSVGEVNGKGGRMTMTAAGVSALILSGAGAGDGVEKMDAKGKVTGCGHYVDNPFIAKGLKWLEQNFVMQTEGTTFYNLYGIERLGRLTGHRFIGKHDWYREGCEFLVSKQSNDGSWWAPKFSDQMTTASTAFALLFLSKGRTPVLISKLVHGDWPRDVKDNDWNLDRNAIKNLTEHISKDLFEQRDKAGNKKPMPLAWQAFDLMQAKDARGETSEANVNAITAEMLQSPIIFINGHKAPKLTAIERELLKRYVESGGFIVAEACCGSKEFDEGFRKLVKEIWENNDLRPLPANHPVFHYPEKIPNMFDLHGLEMGCKTVLIYAPKDMSCLWEQNDQNTDVGKFAFRTGENIVAYATGMVPPLPRLTDIIIAGKDAEKNITPPRFYLKLAQIVRNKNWTPPAPAAVSNLMAHLRKYAGMDVVLTPEKMVIDHQDLANFKFIYFHDRNKFEFGDDQLERLRFNLKNGGLLFADACCGSKLFDESFRKLAKQLFPDHPLQPVKEDDVLFSAKLNGQGNALTSDNIKVRKAPGKSLVSSAPLLEGIKINGKWAVLYSKYDIGCALERHTANDCIGYDHDSALRIASAAVLYLMTPVAK